VSWLSIALLVAGCYGFKALGVTAFGSFVERRFGQVVVLHPAALFTALVVVLTFEEAGRLVVDARVAGVATGALAAWRKAPLIVVVLTAMGVTAVIRALS